MVTSGPPREGRWGEVGAQATVRRLAEAALGAQPQRLHVDHEARGDPVRAERVLAGHLVGERAGVGGDRVEQLPEQRPDPAGDAAADPAAVEQSTVGGRLADQQGAEPGGRAGLGAPAADHPGRTAPVRELQPVPAAHAGLVARGEPLADHALEPLLVGRVEQRSPVVVRRRDLPPDVVEAETVQQLAAGAQRLAEEVAAVEAEQVEDEVGHRAGLGERGGAAGVADVHPLGQRAEAGQPAVEDHDLTVEQHVAAGQLGQLRVGRGDVVLVAAGQPDARRAPAPRRTSARMRMPSHLISWDHSAPVGTWVPRVASIGRMRVIIPQGSGERGEALERTGVLDRLQISALRLSRMAGE